MPLKDNLYINRCISLANLGGRNTRPNPKVGAVIVYNDKIIGEGYHQFDGGPHAEVNAIKNVQSEHLKFLPKSTIYISLEPCCFRGRTPACTDLLIKHKIPKVVIAAIDPFEHVNHKGVNTLKEVGIDVKVVNDPHAQILLEEFKANAIQKRPFVQLKFAKSKNHYLGVDGQQIWLSNESSKVFTHKLRAYTDAILIGTNTAVTDNPALTLREYPGQQPLRIVLDRENRIPLSHKILSDDLPTLIINENQRKELSIPNEQIQISFDSNGFISRLLSKLIKRNIYHLMVEGGGKILKSFVDSKMWDEAVIIDTPVELSNGIKAPNIEGNLYSTIVLGNNTVSLIKNAPSISKKENS